MKMQKSDWLSERVIFGGLIIIGYYTMVIMAASKLVDADGKAVVHDSLLAIGPMIGIIVQSIWKTDKVDKVNAEAAATRAAKAPDLSTATVAPVVPAVPVVPAEVVSTVAPIVDSTGQPFMTGR